MKVVLRKGSVQGRIPTHRVGCLGGQEAAADANNSDAYIQHSFVDRLKVATP